MPIEMDENRRRKYALKYNMRVSIALDAKYRGPWVSNLGGHQAAPRMHLPTNLVCVCVCVCVCIVVFGHMSHS